MESLEQKREAPVSLGRATETDIKMLLELEKSVAGPNTYSPMLEEDDWIEELKTCSVFLIRNGGEVVGNISYEMKNPEHLYISGLVVKPEFQGKGIAKKALKQVLDEHFSIKQ